MSGVACVQTCGCLCFSVPVPQGAYDKRLCKWSGDRSWGKRPTKRRQANHQLESSCAKITCGQSNKEKQ